MTISQSDPQTYSQRFNYLIRAISSAPDVGFDVPALFQRCIILKAMPALDSVNGFVHTQQQPAQMKESVPSLLTLAHHRIPKNRRSSNKTTNTIRARSFLNTTCAPITITRNVQPLQGLWLYRARPHRNKLLPPEQAPSPERMETREIRTTKKTNRKSRNIRSPTYDTRRFRIFLLF